MPTTDIYHGAFFSSRVSESVHNRSSSLGPDRPDPAPKSIPKFKSSDALARMAALKPDFTSQGRQPRNDSRESLDMIPQPLSTSSSDLSRTDSASPRHPDLSDEFAKLSDKLINAINQQTTLEDTVAQTRHELETSKARIHELEAEARAQEGKMNDALLTSKAEVDEEKAQLMADLANERKQKGVILREKRSIENELEILTASLFEEANKMVAAANKERDAVERRNQQLREQVKDTELLLANQQEQLIQLKIVMQQMGNEGGVEEVPESVGDSTAPSSPSSSEEKDAHVLRLLEAMNLSPRSLESGGDLSPAPPTTLTHLLKPVCRTDLPAYEDFRLLLVTSQKSHPASRVTSGSYAGLSVMSLGGLSSSSSSPFQPPNSASTSSSAASGQATTTTSPQLPGSFSPNSNADKGPTPLKENKFYKRLLVEDIEPTLRLDLSPSISWLSRRSILSALTENGLIVEPIPEHGIRLYGRLTACALCGEARKDKSNPRTHRMRVSEGQGATKWPLCGLCLEKVRATCDLVGYVRMVRDGVVRCADNEEEKEAWEELIRLRERLFWARMAGGVIPSFVARINDKGSPLLSAAGEASERASCELAKQRRLSGGPQPQTPTNRPPTPTDSSQDPDNNNNNGERSTAELHRSPQESGSGDPSESMPGIRDITPTTPPRFPVREKRGGSWGNLKVNVPKAFASLAADVHVLH